MSRSRRMLGSLTGLAGLLFLAACRQDMYDQPKLETFEATEFFPDGRGTRPRVAGTVARGELRLDEHLYEGKVNGELAASFPFEVTLGVLERGRERYDIFCSACHDHAGYGEGLVIQRGMKQPPSLHVERLREAPPGYYFDVMTNGFGAMYDLADRIQPRDRWAIIGYIRALQLSQNSSLDDVLPEQRARLEARR